MFTSREVHLYREDGQVKYVGYDLISRDDEPSTLAEVCENEGRIYKALEGELPMRQLTKSKRGKH